MAKKVKFPLKMADNAQVRSLEELREHFDLASVLSYYDDGRLLEWLSDRYYEEEAKKINGLASSSADFKKQLCDILGVSFAEKDDVSLTGIAAKNERRERLKRFTADDKILAAVDSVAFTQEELADLLDDDIKIIYLCGEQFKIPGSRENITYVGVNNPTLDVPDGYLEKGIKFQKVKLSGTNDIVWRAENAADSVEAAKLWRSAAELGDAEAAFRLGVCYYKGNGVGRDYSEAVKWIRKAAEQDNANAKKAFTHNGGRFDNFQNSISAGKYFIGMKTDGTVVSEAHTNDWRDIVTVSAGCKAGRWDKGMVVGLKANGTVVALGYTEQCDIHGMYDIIAISAGIHFIVGLRSDGTVVAVGDNEYGQCDTHDWQDVISVATGKYHTAGLKADGTVVTVGNNEYGQCDTHDWTNIVSISAGIYHTAGLKADGTIVAAGKNQGLKNIHEWKDIVAFSVGSGGFDVKETETVYKGHTIGLKADGTVVAVGDNEYGQCNTQSWRDIIAISAGDDFSVGLKKDGSVCVAHTQHGARLVGQSSRFENILGERDFGLVFYESDFAKSHATGELVGIIIKAIGGVDNIRYCDLDFLSENKINIWVSRRADVDKNALEKAGASDVCIQTVINDVTTVINRPPLFGIRRSPTFEDQRKDQGEGIVHIHFSNVSHNIKADFEQKIEPSKFISIDYSDV